LSFPSIPDAEEMDHPRRLKSVEHGGTSLREETFEWPESGPSESSKVKGLGPVDELDEQPLVGPFGAKAAAAMTGAMVTSLLSESKLFRYHPASRCFGNLSLTSSDTLRRAQDPASDRPTFSSTIRSIGHTALTGLNGMLSDIGVDIPSSPFVNQHGRYESLNLCLIRFIRYRHASFHYA
jgi:hypothetical protein